MYLRIPKFPSFHKPPGRRFGLETSRSIVHTGGRYRETEREEIVDDKRILLAHMDNLHTTEGGINRIRRNLKLDTADVVAYCKHIILEENCRISRKGKNWYCETDHIKITVNSSSYTIITAHCID